MGPFFVLLFAPQLALAQEGVYDVPFHSQFSDIASSKWQKVGCGITDLAMVLEYYDASTSTVNALLKEGIAAGAYQSGKGWTYAGLISVARAHGLSGTYFDLRKKSDADALAQLEEDLKDGPVIASVHYKFDPKSSIPHLVVIDGIVGDTVYYNDPAGKTAQQTISKMKFLAAWKKRAVVIRPKAELAIAK